MVVFSYKALQNNRDWPFLVHVDVESQRWKAVKYFR